MKQLKQTMFKKQLAIFLTLFSIAALILALLIFPLTDKDRATYQELLKSSTSQERPLLSYSEHVREGVLKEIWYQDETPLYIRINSDDSQLFFFQQEGQVEVVEQFENVHCLMQERLFYEGGKPMQEVRYMDAKRACYNYNTQVFIAQEAKLWKYRLAGHEPILNVNNQKPTLSGVAHTVEFSIKGKNLDFKAHRFRAKFDTREELL